MPRVALQPTEIGAFRDRLVAVATRLFAEQGYEGVSLRAIGAALGCSAMTPYRYFHDKAEIFAAVRAAGYEEFANALEAASAAGRDPASRLRNLGRAYVRFALDHPHAYRTMFELGQPDPEGYPLLRAAELRAWAPLREAVQAATDAGLLAGDVDTTVHLLWAGVHGLASLHLAGKLAMGRDAMALLEPMLTTLSRGHAPAAKPARHGARRGRRRRNSR